MNNSETSIGGHIKSAGKKFARGLLGKNSISDITKVVSYNDLNGNSKKNIPNLNGDISHIYMGKMNEEEIGIYSDDFLKGILQYYFYCTPKGKNVTLELANCVSEVLGENMEGFMNFEKQKEYIQNFVEKNFGKQEAKRLEIIDLESRHPELFIQLREYEKKIKSEASKKGLGIGQLEKTPSFDKFDFLKVGVNQKTIKDKDFGALFIKEYIDSTMEEETIGGKGFNINVDYGQEIPTLPDKNKTFNSLDIAKYLFWIYNTNPKFAAQIKAIKPEKAKSNFYPIIEISIRMTDLLNGVMIQGGAMKQNQYDAIIKQIINPYINISKYPELNQLREFCIKKLGDKNFETIYMDGNSKRYRTFTEKLNIDISRKKNIRTMTGSALLGILLMSGGLGYIDYKENKKLEIRFQESMNEIFKNKKLVETGDFQQEFVGEKKLEKINEYIQAIYNRFLIRYGSIGKFSELEFKAKIVGCLNNQEVLNILGEGYYDGGMPKEDKIIDEYFLPIYMGEFIVDELSIVPYQNYIKYTDAFINTILLDQDIKTNRDETYSSMGDRGLINALPAVRDIGQYSPKYQGLYANGSRSYELGLLNRGGKSFIVATENTTNGKFNPKEAYNLTSSRGRDFAIDFLKQTQPIISQLLDQYMIRYYELYRKTYSSSENGLLQIAKEKETLRRDVESLLIKDFLRKGLLKKINKDQIYIINNYLDSFVIENRDTLIKSGCCNLMPNMGFQIYEEVMKNTINDKSVLSKPESRTNQTIGYYSLNEFKNKSEIIRYQSSNGDIYFVGSTIIDGKKYFCARKDIIDGPSRYSGNYSINDGYEVAKDYFKTKTNFYQKKLLYEKKLKSSSQRHVDVDEKSKPDTFKNYIKK